MKKWLIIILVLIAAGVAVRIAFFGRRSPRAAATLDIAVEAMTVGRTDVVRKSELIGVLAADKTAPVFPEIMGRVTAVLVREGANVTKGQAILNVKNETVGFDFEEASVKSPINGAVARILVDVGAMVGPQAPAAIVVDFSTVRVALSVAESDAGSIKLGKRIRFSTDALPGADFDATVTEVSPVIDPVTRTVSVKATAGNPRGRLRPGMTCRIIVTIAEKRDVLAIPNDALSDGTVFVAVNDTLAERRTVETGMIGDDYAEITGGLRQGEMVIVMGQQRLAGGEKIQVLVRKQ